MTAKYFIALAALPLVLSACSRSDDGEAGKDDGFEISIDLGDERDGKTNKIKIGGEDGEESKFSIKADGFALDVDLPAITLDSEDFNLNNINLYPGTKITGFNVEDKDGEGGKVILSFVAPAATDEIVSWFEKKMTDENFVVEKDGSILSGKTDDGDPFTLNLTEKSAEETSGKLEFSESD